ncbi:uncharacterized protein LOC135218043 [Macrobrachium nipponense]|uniref:uncharacterized protein LOC135218043 n=1 Tax=Macrobrachium nipponense TaxID=159736 RepID=UPI0030C8A107
MSGLRGESPSAQVDLAAGRESCDRDIRKMHHHKVSRNIDNYLLESSIEVSLNIDDSFLESSIKVSRYMDNYLLESSIGISDIWITTYWRVALKSPEIWIATYWTVALKSQPYYGIKLLESGIEVHMIISEYVEKELQIGNGITVEIVNMGASYSFVSIRYAPFDMDNQMIESVLERYGKIIWIRNNQHTLGKGNGLLNGIRTAKMEIKNNIPSSIRIAGHSVSLMYSGQNRTCYKCGSEDYLVENCVTEKTLREELTDKETHFPEIGKWNRKAKENPGFSVKDQTQDCTGDNEKHLKLNQDKEIQNADDNTDANSKYLIDKNNVSGDIDNDDELKRVSIAITANSTHINESDNEDMHIKESDNEDVTVSEYGIQNNIVKEKETKKSDKTLIETIVEIHRERNDTELSSMEAESVGKTSHEEVIRINFDENVTTEYNDIAEDMLTDESLEREMMNEADDV